MSTPNDIVIIESWHFELTKGGDRAEIVGFVDDEPVRTGPIVRSVAPSLFQVRDGTVYGLGDPDGSVADPFVLPKPTTADRLRAARADLECYHRGEMPTPAEIDSAPRIEEWLVTSDQFPVIVGSVRGHPYFPDGPIATSIVLHISNDMTWARTISRLYCLGRRARLEGPDPPPGRATRSRRRASSSRSGTSSSS